MRPHMAIFIVFVEHLMLWWCCDREKRRKSLADTLFSTLASHATATPEPSSPSPSTSSTSSSSSPCASSPHNNNSRSRTASTSSSTSMPPPPPLSSSSSVPPTPSVSPRGGSPVSGSSSMHQSWSSSSSSVCHYTTLGVSATATQSEIKLAHRALALKLHPDKSTGAYTPYLTSLPPSSLQSHQ
jgi:hypothetical protein